MDSKMNGQRINKPVRVIAYTHYPQQPQEVARFMLELSLKVIR